MPAQVTGLPERRYILPGIVIFGGVLFWYFLGVMPAQGEADDKLAELEQRHRAVQAALKSADGPVTQGALQAAQRTREKLHAEFEKCAQVFKDTDAVLERYFDAYQGKRDLPNPSSFKEQYVAATRSLAARAEALAGRDAAGQKLTPFIFKDWPVPAAIEIEPAQKEFWIQKAVLGAVERVTGAELRSVRVGLPDYINPDLAATLPTLGVAPTDDDRWTHWQWTEVTVEVDLRSAQVGALLAALLTPTVGAEDARLCTELRHVQVKAVKALGDVVTVEYDPELGEKPEDKVDIDAMEPAVRVVATLALLDPPTARRSQ